MAVKAIDRAQRSRQGPRSPQSDSNVLVPSRILIGVLFLVALVAFEIFNFDTTQFALRDFLGTASFIGVQWATVLAIAFCAIDFAGLLRFFLPQGDEGNPPAEVWYLMGAWLLGATLNALMTWWAVNLTLLNHEFGNEVLNRQQLLEIIPIFVAVMVWLTRILFIGAFTVAGGYLFNRHGASDARHKATSGRRRKGARPTAQPLQLRPIPQRSMVGGRELADESDTVPDFLRRRPNRSAAHEDAEDGNEGNRDAQPQRVAPTRRMRRPTRTTRVPQEQEA